jgi:excisionase family DNA binding protein
MDLKTLTEYAAISERTLRDWMHRGSNPLPAVRVGTKILVRRGAFDAWLQKHPLVPAESIDVADTVKEIMSELVSN